MTQENQTHVKDTAKNVMARNNPLAQGRQLALWIGALIFGAVLGWMTFPSSTNSSTSSSPSSPASSSSLLYQPSLWRSLRPFP